MWNYELFVARKIIAGKRYKNSVSAPITKIGIIAVALGVIVMLIALSTGIGLKKKIREKISGFYGHIRIVNYDRNNSLVSVKPLSTEQDFYPEFKAIPEIKHVQLFAQKAGIIKTEKDFEGVILKGVGPDYDWRFFNNYLITGRLPKYKENELSPEVLISKSIADRMQLKAGGQMLVWFVRKNIQKPPKVRKFNIVGIYDSGYPEFDNTFVIADINQIRRLNKWGANQTGGFELLLSDFDDIDRIAQKVYAHIPSEMNSFSIKEKFPVIFEWISLFDSNIAVILFLMFTVSGFNMITVLLVLVLERIRIIGILKALGAKDKSIRKIFLYQATHLILYGLLWGNIIGLGLLFIQKYTGIVRLDPETYYVNHVPIDIDIPYILLLNAGVIILSYALLTLPSYFIAKITPVQAIRFD